MLQALPEHGGRGACEDLRMQTAAAPHKNAGLVRLRRSGGHLPCPSGRRAGGRSEERQHRTGPHIRNGGGLCVFITAKKGDELAAA